MSRHMTQQKHNSHRSKRPAVVKSEPKQVAEHDKPQIPRPTTEEEWRAHWKAQNQPWRVEPEISPERQEELAKRRAIVPDIKQGIYPFRGMKLNRADVEWLLATHDGGRGPVDWNDESQRMRRGLDLRGAILSGENLSGLPLACILGGLTARERFASTSESMATDQRAMASVHLEGANLFETHLEGADLTKGHLERANIRRAYLEKASLHHGHLEEAFLSRAHLEGAVLRLAHLEGAILYMAHLEEVDLRAAFFNNATNLEEIVLENREHGFASLADISWGGVNLAVVDWAKVTMLGEEFKTHQRQTRDGKAKTGKERLSIFEEAVRANRQLAVALQEQGLNEDAARFAYRAQVLQKAAFWFQMVQNDISLSKRVRALFSWLFSWFMFLIAGYGYRFGRSFLTYIAVIGGFATVYYLLGLNDIGPHHVLGPHYLSWYEAFVVSMAAFHGRGFFVGTFSPGDPQALVAAIEAFLGLLIEVTFIATLTQRLFSR
jgi:uncharacterized protein YjbI with pentapeptide repeats